VTRTAIITQKRASICRAVTESMKIHPMDAYAPRSQAKNGREEVKSQEKCSRHETRVTTKKEKMTMVGLIENR